MSLLLRAGTALGPETEEEEGDEGDDAGNAMNLVKNDDKEHSEQIRITRCIAAVVERLAPRPVLHSLVRLVLLLTSCPPLLNDLLYFSS